MRRSKYYLALIAIFCAFAPAFAQGLRFQGMDKRIAERTSYDVFGDKRVRLDGWLSICFSMCTYNTSDFGYILRITDQGESGSIWNLSYDRGQSLTMRLNEEGRFSLIKAELDKENLPPLRWVDVKLELNSHKDSVYLSLGDKVFAEKADLPDTFFPKIQFGRSGFIIDVPSFAIRDLRVSGDNTEYYFPLDESAGTSVRDRLSRIKGKVTNPTWLIRESLEWSQIAELHCQTNAGANYDPERKCFYYFSSDSLYTYDVISGQVSERRVQSPLSINLGMSFMREGRLYAYEPFCFGWQEGDPTIACLDPEAGNWTVVSTDHLSQPFHHHASFMRGDRFEIFGGFGEKMYNGEFYALDEHYRWHRDTLINNTTLFPRYFTAIGQQGDLVYVYGGMGNECGEQIVGRRYFYDLHRIDLGSGSCEKLWEHEWAGEDCVPARTMVIDGDKFYVLCYPEYKSVSRISLYEFAIEDGSYRVLADEIPIISDKMYSNAALYLDSDLKKFFVTTLVFDDDIRSTLKIYSLAYPPRSLAEVEAGGSRQVSWLVILGLIALVVIIAIISYIRYRRERARARYGYLLSLHHPEKKKFSQPDRANAIYLFGDFQVNDKDGRDITGRISAQQKKLLWLLVKYSDSQGVSTSRLSSIFWPDKEEEKVKNSRGVAINHLRNSLADVEGLSIVFDKGYYRLVLDEPCYCDVVDLLGQVSSREPDMDRILSVLSRGKFLKHVDDPVFDSYKSRIENGVSPILQSEIVRRYRSNSWQEVIEIADMILYFDPLDETALKYATSALVHIQRKEDALLRYAAFTSEYRKVNDSDYPVPFEKTIL